MILSSIFLIVTVIISSVIMWLWSTNLFVGPILGAIIATGVTLSANRFFSEQDYKKNKSAFLAALIAETTALHDLIESRKKLYIDMDSKLLDFYITEDYFTVFKENANKLGLLPEDLAARVVRVYIETKGLFDTIRAYSNESREIIKMDEILMQMRVAGREYTDDYNGVYACFEHHYKNINNYSDIVIKSYVPNIQKALLDVREELIKLKTGKKAGGKHSKKYKI